MRGEGRRRGGRDVRATRALATALAVTVVGSAAAVGTVHRSTLLVVAVLALGTAYLALRVLGPASPERGERSTTDLAVPSLVLLVLAALTALQAVPLPVGVLEAIAPSNADVWKRALTPFGESVAWGSISLDPGASVTEALKLSCYSGVMLAAAALASDRATRAWPIVIVFGSAVFIALATSSHDLVGATKVFGIYTPRMGVESHHMGPFLNPNNLAGYLDLGVFCGIGLLLMRAPILPAWAVGLGVAVLVGVEIRSASRGGVAALPIGLLLLAGLVLWSRYRHGVGRAWRAFTVLGAALGAGLVLAIVGGTFGIWRELLQDNVSKIRLLPWTVPLVADHRWFGIGRGAFESVFAAYRAAPGSNTVFTHPENFPIQWIAEWGLVVGGASLLGLAWLLRPWAVGATRSGLAAGAWTGVVVLLIQNLVDLGIEIPGVAVALACVLGGLWGMRRGRPLHDRRPRRVTPRAVVLVGGAGAAAAAVAMLASGLLDVRAERDELRASYERVGDDAGERRAAWAALRGAMLRHPADYYFALLGATMAWRFHEPNPMPWIQRALERAPLSGRTHLLLAEVLAARGTVQQALFELRLAAEYEPSLGGHTAALAVRWAKSFDDLMRAIPAGSQGADVLDDAASRTKDPQIAQRADEEVLRRDPGRLAPRQRAIATRLAAMREGGAALCADRARCEREIEEQCAAIERVRPDSSMAAQLRTQLLVEQGKLGEAADLLAGACSLPQGRADCLSRYAGVLGALGRQVELAATLKAFVSESCATALACAEAHAWVGNFHEGRRENALAVAAFRRAALEDPTEQRWLRLADAAERGAQPVVVIEALEKVAQRRGGADPALRKRIDAARATNATKFLPP